jgi:hypothetical protein
VGSKTSWVLTCVYTGGDSVTFYIHIYLSSFFASKFLTSFAPVPKFTDHGHGNRTCAYAASRPRPIFLRLRLRLRLRPLLRHQQIPHLHPRQ